MGGAAPEGGRIGSFDDKGDVLRLGRLAIRLCARPACSRRRHGPVEPEMRKKIFQMEKSGSSKISITWKRAISLVDAAATRLPSFATQHRAVEAFHDAIDVIDRDSAFAVQAGGLLIVSKRGAGYSGKSIGRR